MTEIKRLSKRYLFQTMAIMLVLIAIALLLMAFAICSSDIVAPLIVSVVFAVAVELADALIWKWVAGQHPDSLPSVPLCRASVCCWPLLQWGGAWWLLAAKQCLCM